MSEEAIQEGVQNDTAPESSLLSAAPTAEVSGDWKSAIPDEFRNDPSIQSIKDIPSLAKSYIHAQRMVGAEKIPAPRDDWDDDQWNHFYDRLGRPAKPEDYQLALPKDLPEGLPVSEERLNSFTEVAHKAGLSKKQVGMLMEWDTQTHVDMFTEHQRGNATGRLAAEQELKKAWGPAFEQNLGVAQRVVQEFGAELGIPAVLEGAGLANDPVMTKFLHGIGMQMLEDTALGESSSKGFLPTPEQGMRELSELRSDPKFVEALMGKHGPQAAKEALAKQRQLQKIAHPD